MALPLIVAPFVGWFTTFIASSVARFIALKVLLTTLFVVVLPIVLNNLIVSVMTAIYDKAVSSVSSVDSVIVSMTGLAGYIANALSLPLVLSILLGAISVSFTLNLLRIK